VFLLGIISVDKARYLPLKTQSGVCVSVCVCVCVCVCVY
jgi:hypothetical protein